MVLNTARILFVSLIVSLAPAMASDLLPRPAGLETEVEFWGRVFAEIPSSRALVHDSRHLDVVYEVAQIPPGASPSKRRRVADKARSKYRNILNRLADQPRAGLSAEQRRVLAQWPADITSEELKQAAQRIRFQQGLADRFRDGMLRSGAWKTHIEANLIAAGVPVGLSALPHVESSFNPEARSHVGASGLWQFTRSTGRRFMQIDHIVDERRDPFMSSKAAAQLLAYNYSILRSWPLAITAYNHGVAGMRRAVRTLGTEDIEVIIRDYNGRTFGFASRNFYVAFLAALALDRSAEEHFGPLTPDAPSDDLVIVVPDYLAAVTLQQAFGMPMPVFKQHNPALMPSVWDGTKHVPKGFSLRVPQKAVSVPPTEIFAAIPARLRFTSQTPDLYHKVQRGESLSVIAARYDTSVRDLVALNGLRSRHRIRAGQTLRLPYTGQKIDATMDSYAVRRGDTVGTIAARAGMTETELVTLNSLDNRNRIYEGQVLQLRAAEIPADMPAVATVADAATTPANEVSSSDHTITELVSIVVEAPAETAAEMQDGNVLAEIQVDVERIDANAPAGDVLLADPSDYMVAEDGTIEVQAAETLGHYADWLGIRTQKLRDLNGYSFRQPLVIGRRLHLEFSAVDRETFVAHRVAYHREMQEAFFVRYRVTETTAHNLRRGESVWYLTLRRYKVPVWLLRQYNPDLDLGRVRPGMRVVFPQIEPIDVGSTPRRSIAEAS